MQRIQRLRPTFSISYVPQGAKKANIEIMDFDISRHHFTYYLTSLKL